jgi:hypothetical protein
MRPFCSVFLLTCVASSWRWWLASLACCAPPPSALPGNAP